MLQRGVSRITIGVGMIPRGEVGLIFAGAGRALKVIDDATFSAAVTPMITPPVLKIALAQAKGACRT